MSLWELFGRRFQDEKHIRNIRNIRTIPRANGANPNSANIAYIARMDLKPKNAFLRGSREKDNPISFQISKNNSAYIAYIADMDRNLKNVSAPLTSDGVPNYAKHETGQTHPIDLVPLPELASSSQHLGAVPRPVPYRVGQRDSTLESGTTFGTARDSFSLKGLIQAKKCYPNVRDNVGQDRDSTQKMLSQRPEGVGQQKLAYFSRCPGTVPLTPNGVPNYEKHET